MEHTMDSETPGQKTSKAKEPQRNPILHVLQQLARPVTAGPLLITGLCLALAYKNRKKWGTKEAAAATHREPKEAAAATRRQRLLQRSMSIAALHGGNVAMQRIMDSLEVGIDQANLDDAVTEFQRLVNEKLLNFTKLQSTAAKLEMSGKEDEAVEMLQKALANAEKERKLHEAYELEMLLVEMLIYQGKYQDALNCKCLEDKEMSMSDARIPLYQAIIYWFKGDSKKAEQCYKEFKDVQSQFHWPDSVKEVLPVYVAASDFKTFEKIVSSLKKAIEDAYKMKQAYKAKA